MCTVYFDFTVNKYFNSSYASDTDGYGNFQNFKTNLENMCTPSVTKVPRPAFPTCLT
jgi:hypothetical protein